LLKINKLIVIAGLSRAGKSTLITQLNNGELNKLSEKLDFDPSYQFLHAIEVDQLNQTVDKLVIHYDLFARFSKQTGFDSLDKLMTSAKQITILTLCASSNTLIERMDLTLLKLLNLLQDNSKKPPYEDQLPLINKLRARMITQQYYKINKPFHSYTPIGFHTLNNIQPVNIG
jgi:ABC-type phosphate/phosphonate transport system ATPase subunit